MMPADLGADLPSASGTTCAHCEKPAKAKGLCWCCYKRLSRGKSLSDPVQQRLSAYDRVLKASEDVADADTGDDEGYQRALYRLRKAVERYAREAFGRRGGLASTAQLSAEARRAIGVRLAAMRWRRNRQLSTEGRNAKPPAAGRRGGSR